MIPVLILSWCFNFNFRRGNGLASYLLKAQTTASIIQEYCPSAFIPQFLSPSPRTWVFLPLTYVNLMVERDLILELNSCSSCYATCMGRCTISGMRDQIPFHHHFVLVQREFGIMILGSPCTSKLKQWCELVCGPGPQLAPFPGPQ